MKVSEVLPFVGEIIFFECSRCEFVRYGADEWYAIIGNIESPCESRAAELEDAYQKWKSGITQC